MCEEAVNECRRACAKCVGYQFSFLSEWQKLNKVFGGRLKSRFKTQTRNIFFFQMALTKTESLHESLQAIWSRTTIYFQKDKTHALGLSGLKCAALLLLVTALYLCLQKWQIQKRKNSCWSYQDWSMTRKEQTFILWFCVVSYSRLCQPLL